MLKLAKEALIGAVASPLLAEFSPATQFWARELMTADDVIGRAEKKVGAMAQTEALAEGLCCLPSDQQNGVREKFEKLVKNQAPIDVLRMETEFGIKGSKQPGMNLIEGLYFRASRLEEVPKDLQAREFSVLVSSALTFDSPEKVGLCLSGLTETPFFKEDAERAMNIIHQVLQRMPDESAADQARLARVVKNIAMGADKAGLHPALKFYTNRMLTDRVKCMPSDRQSGMLTMLAEQAAKLKPELGVRALGEIAAAAIDRLDPADANKLQKIFSDHVRACPPPVLPDVFKALIDQVHGMSSAPQSDVLTLLAEEAAKLEPRFRMGILGDIATAAIDRLNSIHMKGPLNILADHVKECKPDILPVILCGLILQDLAKDDVNTRRPGRQLEPNDRADMMVKLAGKLGECQDKTNMFDMLHGMSINYLQNQIPVERKLSILEALSEQLPNLDSGITASALALLNESDNCPENQDRTALLDKVDEFARTSEKLKARVDPNDPGSVTWGEVIRLELQPRREMDAVARYVPD